MTITELSGRDGYLTSGGIEYPLYSWILNSQRTRDTYRKSNSSNYPKRQSGLPIDVLNLYGPNTTCPLSFASSISFNVGWIDWTANLRRYITFAGALVNTRIDFNYGRTTSTSWNAIVNGISSVKVFNSSLIIPFDDNIACAPSLCDYSQITTTDSVGIIESVKKASIETICEREQYRTSNSSNQYRFTYGVYDRIVILDIEGCFDYWQYRLTYNTPYTYKFYYSSNGYVLAENMIVLDISNLKVNIQTGDLVSATVRLGASYG